MTETYQYIPAWRVLNRGKPYEPFWYQAQHIHAQVDRGCKRIICAWGRRGGKSTAIVAEVVREVIKEPVTVRGVEHSPIVYIVGPNAEASMRVWEPVWAAFVPPEDGSFSPPYGFLHDWHDKQRGVIAIKGGARIYRKTGESPAATQGERVTLVITDETQDMPEDVWQYLMPGLTESEGILIAIGVSKGIGRFKSYWFAGQTGEGGFYSSAVPSTANPIIQELAKKAGKTPEQWLRDNSEEDLTENEFRQQYLAEWVGGDGQVFNKYEHLFTVKSAPDPLTEEAAFKTYLEEHPGPYIASLDLGKLNDFTVLYIGDVLKSEIVFKYRVNKLDYIDQMPIIIKIMKTFKVRFVHMDTNGPGEAPSEMIRAEYVSVIPFPWSNSNKQALVSAIVRAVERSEVHFLEDDDTLKNEMGLFQGTVSPGGVIKYDAAPGYHDDCVISAALCVQKMARNRTMAISPVRKPYVSWGGRKVRRSA